MMLSASAYAYLVWKSLFSLVFLTWPEFELVSVPPKASFYKILLSLEENEMNDVYTLFIIKHLLINRLIKFEFIWQLTPHTHIL